ncbi:MAG: hypothetical protein KGL39_21565 [Patescibacteria group bacterium]|nr:hypothetical protein [Patescibacteria group bacterium]
MAAYRALGPPRFSQPTPQTPVWCFALLSADDLSAVDHAGLAPNPRCGVVQRPGCAAAVRVFASCDAACDWAMDRSGASLCVLALRLRFGIVGHDSLLDVYFTPGPVPAAACYLLGSVEQARGRAEAYMARLHFLSDGGEGILSRLAQLPVLERGLALERMPMITDVEDCFLCHAH